MPALVASIKAGEQWQDSRDQLAPFAAGKPIFPSTFALTDASFDLTKAAALYDDAFALGTPAALRRQKLFDALRLGDAIAPATIATELQQTSGASPSLEKLRQLSAARRARDVAAKTPRALLVRAIDARLRNEDYAPLLAEAADAGSVLADRLLTAHRIEKSMSHEADRPPSWGLPDPLIAELDASLAVWETPAFSTEWQFVSNALNIDNVSEVRTWFYPAVTWEIDRQQRLADAELVRAVQPQIDTILATLATWPGIDHQDPRHTELLNEASRFRASAEDLAPTDGIGSLGLFLQAAACGDRSALEKLANHIRLGLGELPRSYELANALADAELKMALADAEVGDSAAAEQLAHDFLKNPDAANDSTTTGLTWLRYAAELGERTAAIVLRDRALAAPVDHAAARHWAVVIEAIDNQELLPTSPRHPPADLAPLATVRAELETLLADAEQNLADAAPTEAQRNVFNPCVQYAKLNVI
ncbi:MAG TPA: hypothetical protein VHN79_03025 [Lacunisphaera sp.]|nr:hypothetical protein [Lacunisphaera sp.]